MTPVWCDAAADWVAAHIPGCERGFGKCRALAVEHEGEIIAGVVFHDWNPERGLVELSCAATDRRWISGAVLGAVWGYGFAIARMAISRTSERNTPVRKIWRACGAREHIIPDLWGEGEAGVILTLTKDQWQASRLHRRQHEQT